MLCEGLELNTGIKQYQKITPKNHFSLWVVEITMDDYKPKTDTGSSIGDFRNSWLI